MASNSKYRRPRSINSRPLMLKDFLLLDDSGSCSSSGFKPFPRFPSGDANSPDLLQHLNYASRALGAGPPPAKLQRSRSRSRSAAEAAIAALQRLFPSLKKKLSSTTTEKEFLQVRVKDILRWRSFRDLIDGLNYQKEDEEALPLDCFSASPIGRSRLDEAPEWPPREWEGEKCNVGGADPMIAGTGTSELCCSDYEGPSKDEHISNNGEEQHSPVSILDSPFRDDTDFPASFDQSLANVERTKLRLLESIQWLETLAGVKPTDSDEEDEIDDLIEEPTIEARARTHGRCKDEKLEEQVTKEAKANPGYKKEPELEECVREMEKEAQWGQYEEQANQIGTELGLEMLDALVDEALVDLLGRSN